jgi:hypothetical protein
VAATRDRTTSPKTGLPTGQGASVATCGKTAALMRSALLCRIRMPRVVHRFPFPFPVMSMTGDPATTRNISP